MRQDNPLRAQDLRVHNQNIILSRIYEKRNTGISQSELVMETGLKAPTVFRIFSDLEDQGLIEIHKNPGGVLSGNSEENLGRKGRRPVVYTVRKDALYTMGLEFWASSISLGVFNFNGNRVFSRVEPLKTNIDIAEVIDFIVFLVTEALNSLEIGREKVPGIGVVAPGQVDIIKRKVINYPRIQNMRDIPLAEELEKRLGIKVLLHNNCSALALSEFRYGGYDHQGSLFTFLIRSGVNGAFVDDRGIYVTSRGITLESGHIPIDSGGPLCSCGNRGCLESLLVALDNSGETREKPLFSEMEGMLAAGCPEADHIMTQAAGYLFIAMKSIMRFFTPHAFLILGNGALVSRRIAEKVRERWAQESDAFVSDAPMIYSHACDPLVSQRGASDLVIADYFS
jgi:predicted NBD/HSP70 family sugar kinase/DNA-binding transcriptional regulator YhcF (GntR family)